MEVLQEFSDFLENNPREVITFFIEDRLKNNALFTTVLGQANLSKHLLNTKHFGRGTKAWPTLEEMASELGRLVVFSDNKDETSVIAYTYNYVIENNFGNPSQDTNVSHHSPNFSFSFCYFRKTFEKFYKPVSATALFCHGSQYVQSYIIYAYMKLKTRKACTYMRVLPIRLLSSPPSLVLMKRERIKEI